jgi:hypothetical protein
MLIMTKLQLIEEALRGSAGLEVVYHQLRTEEEQQYILEAESEGRARLSAYHNASGTNEQRAFWLSRGENIFLNTSNAGYVRIERCNN